MKWVQRFHGKGNVQWVTLYPNGMAAGLKKFKRGSKGHKSFLLEKQHYRIKDLHYAHKNKNKNRSSRKSTKRRKSRH